VRREIPESKVVTSNAKQGEDWTGSDYRRSLRANQRQGSKKFLIVVIESRLNDRSLFLGRCLN